MTAVAVRQRVLGAPAEVRYTLYRELPWLDVEVRLDWDARDFGRVELVWETPHGGSGAHYGLPFGVGRLDDGSLMPGSGPVRGDEAAPASWRRTREIARWLSIDAPEGGVIMATDHRWTRVDEQEGADGGKHVRCCLVRGGRIRPASPETDGDDQRVRLAYRFRFLPHDGDWRAARAPRAGWEAAQPLLSYTVNDTWSEKSLPRATSLATIQAADDGDVALTCLKQSEDGLAAVARWYETLGARCDVAVDIPPSGTVVRTDLEERPLEPSMVPSPNNTPTDTGAWQIVTVRSSPSHRGAA